MYIYHAAGEKQPAIEPHPSSSKPQRHIFTEFKTTADMDDGQSLPPYADRGTPWQVVSRSNGRTTWCRRWSVR